MILVKALPTQITQALITHSVITLQLQLRRMNSHIHSESLSQTPIRISRSLFILGHTDSPT